MTLRLMAIARPYAPRLLLAGLLAALTELAGLCLLGTATYLLVRAAEQPPLSALTVAIVAVRALALGRGALRYAERLAGHDATLRLLTEVRTRVYAALAARRSTADLRRGDLLSRLVSDVDAVQDLLLRCLVPAAAAVLVAAVAIGWAAIVAPAAAAAMTVGLLAAGVGLPALAAVLAARTADRVAPLRGALADDAVDLTHGAADLAAYGVTDQALARTADRADELAGLERRLAAAAWAVDGCGVVLGGLTAAAVVIVATGAGADGLATAVLAVATLIAVESVLALVGSARRWVEIRSALARISELLDGPPPPDEQLSATTGRARDAREPARSAANGTVDAPRPPLAGGIELALDRVTVRYAADRAPALSHVDLQLPAGKRIAVVGPSGAGKSTLIAVLSGLLPPDEGRVTAGGRDLADLPEPDVRRAIGGLLADAHIFHASVRENIGLGRADASETDLAAAMDAAGLRDWVDALPQGWETVAGEEGAQLSGGQQQRLALARAMLARPAVLVLDEPTEGLDPAAADEVLARVLRAAGDAAVLLVTHRFSGLAAMDEIVVLDVGRIIDRGRHAELVERPGWYRERWLAQRAAERGYLLAS